MPDYSKKSYKTGQHALTEKEIEQLLSVVDDLVTEVAIRLAIVTGIRREDLAGLSWKDVRLDESRIVFWEQKKKRTKEVVLHEKDVTMLRKLRNEYPDEHYVFPGGCEKKYGKGHLSGRTLYNRFQKYLEKAGLRSRPVHALRATCIKLCQKRGWTPEQTAEHVGDTVRVIQEHYLTPTLDEMKETVQENPIL